MEVTMVRLAVVELIIIIMQIYISRWRPTAMLEFGIYSVWPKLFGWTERRAARDMNEQRRTHITDGRTGGRTKEQFSFNL